MDNELILIKKAVAGDEDSFRQLIDIYKNYVFAIILNFIKDYSEVENVAQEVFLQIYLSLPGYKDDNFKGWIGKIASNKSIDWIRRKRSKFREETLEDSEIVIDRVGMETGNNPEDILINKENREYLIQILNSMPIIYRESIEKFYFQDKSYEEIAKDENVTVKTIASRLYRGKNILKEKWSERI
jgi:RNA polymerase sigma factor (sigma-70 family)